MYYKYLPISRLSYFEDGLLRFTQPKALNDSFECLPTFSSCAELISKISGKTLEENFFEAKTLSEISGEYFMNDYFDQLKFEFNGFGIFSLSKRYDSNLMWGHYAKHSGCAIGFNLDHSFFNSDKFLRGKVKYSNQRTILTDNELDENIFFTKSKDWSYEREFRLIAELKDHDEKIDKPVPIYLFKIPFETISEIIVGLNIEYEDLIRIKKFCDEFEIPLFRCKQSNKNFTVEKQLII